MLESSLGVLRSNSAATHLSACSMLMSNDLAAAQAAETIEKSNPGIPAGSEKSALLLYHCPHFVQGCKTTCFFFKIRSFLRHWRCLFKVGRWAELAVFKQYLWNGWTDSENRFDKKERPHRGTHGRSLILFGVMTSSHEQKRTMFFFCPSVTFFLGYSSFISLVDHGRETSGLLTPIEWRSFFSEFRLEMGEF